MTKRTADALSRALGPEFTPARSAAGTLGLPMVRHASGVEFVLIPGGTFEMGLSTTEERALLAAMRTPDGRAAAKELARAARPRHQVRVAPFLCARAPLVEDGSVALVSAAEAARMVKRAKLRLLSEAEWEYVARDGGSRAWIGLDDAETDVQRALARHAKSLYGRSSPPSGAAADRFGVWALALGDWVADSWHQDYRRAPRDGAPWKPGKAPGVRRGGAASLYPWQDADEHLESHAAIRLPAARGTFACVRFALDLPPGSDGLVTAGRQRSKPRAPEAKRARAPVRSRKPTKPRASSKNDPTLVARAEALALARWAPASAAQARARVDCFRFVTGRYEATLLVVVRARTRERAFGERAFGPDRRAALAALVAKLERA